MTLRLPAPILLDYSAVISIGSRGSLARDETTAETIGLGFLRVAPREIIVIALETSPKPRIEHRTRRDSSPNLMDLHIDFESAIEVWASKSRDSRPTVLV